MTVWRAFATCIVLIVAAVCLFCFAPAPAARSYPDAEHLRGDPVIRGIYEALALRGVATETGADVKAMLWRSLATVMFAAALAAATWRLLRRRGRGRAGLDAAAADTEERRALLKDWPAGGLPERPKEPTAFRLAVAGLLAYMLINLAACMWSDAPWLSLAAATDRAIGVVWCLLIALLLRRRWAGRAAIGITILTALAALLGLWFFASGNDPWGGRLNFPMSNPDFLAAVLLMPLCVCVAGLGHVFRPRQLGRGATWGRRPRLRAWAGIGSAAGVAFLGCGMILAGSRGAMFGLAVAAAVYLCWRLRRLWKLIPLVVLVVGAVAGGLWTVSRFGTPGDGRAESAETRIYIWRHALTTIGQKPFIGHGPAAHVRKNQLAAGEDSILGSGPLDAVPEYHAHNEFLEVAEEVGVAAAAVFLAALIAAAAGGLRSGRAVRQTRPLLPAAVAAGACGMLAHQLFGEALRHGEVAAFFWTWIGLLLALAREPMPAAPVGPADSDKPFMRMTASSLALIAGLVLASVVVARGVWPGYEAKMISSRMHRTRDMSLWLKARKRDGKPRRFERLLARDMNVAHRLETWQWRAEQLVKTAENPATEASVRKQALDEARQILSDLHNLVPDFDRVQLWLARSRRAAGDEAGSRRAILRHRRKWPRDRHLPKAAPPAP